MRVTLNLSMVEPQWLVPLAVEAETCGFDGVSTGDSLFHPRESTARYPYTETGDRSFIEGKPFVDPIVAGAAVLTATTRLAFQTAVLKLGPRHPVLVAKQVATLAALAPGRIRLGVGSSPWPEDLTVLGLPAEGRGRRFEESIQVVRALLREGYQSFAGAVYDVPELRIDPQPPSPVPILVGGHGTANLRRAARLGDGWIAAATGAAALREMISAIRDERERSDRTAPFSIHAPLHAGGATIPELAAMGVTDVTVRPALEEAAGDLEVAKQLVCTAAQTLPMEGPR